MIAGGLAMAAVGLALLTQASAFSVLRKPSDDASASDDNTEPEGMLPTAVPAAELAA